MIDCPGEECGCPRHSFSHVDTVLNLELMSC